jgi:hypothetical protein
MLTEIAEEDGEGAGGEEDGDDVEDGDGSSSESEWEEVKDGEEENMEDAAAEEESDEDSDSERLSSGANAGTCEEYGQFELSFDLIVIVVLE